MTFRPPRGHSSILPLRLVWPQRAHTTASSIAYLRLPIPPAINLTLLRSSDRFWRNYIVILQAPSYLSNSLQFSRILILSTRCPLNQHWPNSPETGIKILATLTSKKFNLLVIKKTDFLNLHRKFIHSNLGVRWSKVKVLQIFSNSKTIHN